MAEPILTPEEKTEHDQIVAWLRGKSRDELNILESGLRFYYEDSLKRRNPKTGAYSEQPVWIRVPNSSEVMQAHIAAVAHVRTVAKDPAIRTVEDAQKAITKSSFNEIDTIFLLSSCIFEKNKDGTFSQYMLFAPLMAVHQRASLYEIADRLDFYTSLEDPRINEMSDNMFHAVIRSIARVQSLGPLVAIGPEGRDTFMLRSIVLLDSLLPINYFQNSPANGTPEPFPAKT